MARSQSILALHFTYARLPPERKIFRSNNAFFVLHSQTMAATSTFITYFPLHRDRFTLFMLSSISSVHQSFLSKSCHTPQNQQQPICLSRLSGPIPFNSLADPLPIIIITLNRQVMMMMNTFRRTGGCWCQVYFFQFMF